MPDRHPVHDVETDRLIKSKLMAMTPMADEEKLTAICMKLVQLLVDDDVDRKLYVRAITMILNQDVVEAARAAFASSKGLLPFDARNPAGMVYWPGFPQPGTVG